MNFIADRRLGVILLVIILSLSGIAFSKDAQKLTTKRKKIIKPPTKQEKTNALYDSLSAKANRSWFLKNLYPIVFSADSVEATIHTDDQNFERWKGKVIRSISIKCVEVFPPDSTDSEQHTLSLLKRVGNEIHIQTREWVIKDNLLFHTGDKLSPKVLRRNIAYLRSLNYLSDIKFFIISTKQKSDSVDVLIVVQDKFSISLKGQFKSINKFNIRIDDQNFLGLGNQLKNEWRIDPQHQNSVGWISYYSIPNIRRTFIKGEMEYSDLPGYNRKYAGLNRQFLFPVLHAAGGLDIAQTNIRAPVDTNAVNRIELGGWGGYCIKGNPGPANQYAYTAMSFKQTWYQKRPNVGPTYGRLWHESLLAVGSLALTQSEYTHLPYVYSFLENEDIPIGFLYELLYGYEFGEYRNREYLGLRGTRGVAHENGSFLYLKGGIETFISKSGPEQGVLVFEPLYITTLKTIGKFHTRTFVRQRIILGNNRFRGETLSLSTDPYFRGNQNLSGNNLMAMGVENDLVAPWDVIGFNIAFFGFVDGVVVSDILYKTNVGDLLLTEGVGIRIRNTKLVWRSLELHVALNHIRNQHSTYDISLIAKVPLKMVDFEGRKPKPYEFR